MLTKLYFGTLAIAAVIVGALCFYANSWLSSIGDPSAAYAAFTYYLGLSWNALWITTAVLLILSNIVFWRSRGALTMWATFAYFTLFILLRYFWLESAAAAFRGAKLGTEGGFNLSIFLGVILIFLFAVIVFFNQYLGLRLYERMYPPAEPDIEAETVQ